MRAKVTVLIVVTLIVGLPAQSEGPLGDEVTLNDGSILKGEIIFIENDTVWFESPSFDPIRISVDDVKSVTTGSDVDVVDDTGKTWRGKIGANAQGDMIFKPEGGGEARPLDFDFVDGVYQLRPIWYNNLTLGMSSTTGNSEVLGVSLLGDGQLDSEVHRLTWIGQLSYAEANGSKAEQNGSATFGYGYFFRPRLYLSTAEELYHNRFKDIRVRSVTSVSLGYVFLRKPETVLEGEIGGGALVQRFYDAEKLNEVAVRGSGYCKVPVGASMTLEDLFVIYLSNGAGQVQISNTFTFSWSLTSRWSFTVVNLFNYNSEDFFAEASDFQWTVGLTYTF